MSVSYNSYWFLHLGRLFILRFTWQWKSFWELMVKKVYMAKFRMLGYIYVWLHWCRELGVCLWRYPAPITTPLNIPRTPFAKKRRLPGIKFCIYKKLIQSLKKKIECIDFLCLALRAPYSDRSVRPSEITCSGHIFSPLAQSGSYFTYRVPLGEGCAVVLNKFQGLRLKS